MESVLEEHASGGRWDRPNLHHMIDFLRPGDTVVVWKLDRLSRSLKDLLHIMELIGQKQAGFRSLTQAADTTASAGRMLVLMLGSFAEFAREMIRERTRAGFDAARARGRRLGRPRKLNDVQRQDVVVIQVDLFANHVECRSAIEKSNDSEMVCRLSPTLIST